MYIKREDAKARFTDELFEPSGKSAQEILDEIPTAEPQGELISREDAIEAVASITMSIHLSEVICDKLLALPSADAEWIPLSHDDDGMGTDFPYECDGEWVIVTDGNTISVERIKKDAYDHFYPNGRWFELDDVIAWMPLPKPYREDGE